MGELLSTTIGEALPSYKETVIDNIEQNQKHNVKERMDMLHGLIVPMYSSWRAGLQEYYNASHRSLGGLHSIEAVTCAAKVSIGLKGLDTLTSILPSEQQIKE